jgi:DNA-binding transcriptional MerR regulator
MLNNTVMIVAKSYSLNIDELSDEIGRLLKANNLVSQQQDNRVSPVPDMRTIRYYSGLGLVDRPSIMGRVARYSGRHILQLLAIKVLQGASLPLAEIQTRLYGLSDSELENIISMYLDDQAKILNASHAASTTVLTPIPSSISASASLSASASAAATSPLTVPAIQQIYGRVSPSVAVSWQEIEVVPGLKIMAEQSWLENLNASVKQSGQPVDRALLHKKITAALDALIGIDIESNGENI